MGRISRYKDFIFESSDVEFSSEDIGNIKDIWNDFSDDFDCINTDGDLESIEPDWNQSILNNELDKRSLISSLSIRDDYLMYSIKYGNNNDTTFESEKSQIRDHLFNQIFPRMKDIGCRVYTKDHYNSFGMPNVSKIRSQYYRFWILLTKNARTDVSRIWVPVIGQWEEVK